MSGRSGVDYSRIGDSADTVLKWYVAPLAFGAVFLVIAVTALGWWRPALLETTKAASRWLLIGPAFMAVAAVITLVTSDKSKTTLNMFWLILIGSLLVGFCEELATRGVLITGFRAAWTEPRVWFVSTLLFALLHLPNWAFGAGPIATFQGFTAFFAGSMLYLTHRSPARSSPRCFCTACGTSVPSSVTPPSSPTHSWRSTPSSRWSWYWSSLARRNVSAFLSSAGWFTNAVARRW